MPIGAVAMSQPSESRLDGPLIGAPAQLQQLKGCLAGCTRPSGKHRGLPGARACSRLGHGEYLGAAVEASGTAKEVAGRDGQLRASRHGGRGRRAGARRDAMGVGAAPWHGGQGAGNSTDGRMSVLFTPTGIENALVRKFT